MPTITVTADYDAYVIVDNFGVYGKASTGDYLYCGYTGGTGWWIKYRSLFRFSLATLPLGATVTQVRRRLYVQKAGGASHLVDDHAYGSNGQEDPELDNAQTCFNRCSSGNLYQNDSTELRTTGEKWAILGGTVCSDVENAKLAVNRFSLAIHEENDNDPYALLHSRLKSGGSPPQIEITYVEVPLRVGYMDGFVLAQWR